MTSSLPVQCASDVTHTLLFTVPPPELGTMHIQFQPSTETISCTTLWGNPFAVSGNRNQGALTHCTTNNTLVQDAGSPLTEPMHALTLKRSKPKTPYNAESWEKELLQAGLAQKYVGIPRGL